MNSFLTINDLIERLNKIPVEDRNLPLCDNDFEKFINDIQFIPNKNKNWYKYRVYLNWTNENSNN